MGQCNGSVFSPKVVKPSNNGNPKHGSDRENHADNRDGREGTITDISEKIIYGGQKGSAVLVVPHGFKIVYICTTGDGPWIPCLISVIQMGFYVDFLSVSPLEPLTDALHGCAFRKEDIAAVLGQFQTRELFGSITSEEVLETIFYNK